MHYYVWKDEEGKVIGWYACEGEYSNPTATEVSREEYIQSGGNPETVMNQEPLEAQENHIKNLQQANKLLRAQTQMQSEQITFLENCILEIAEVVYA